MKKVLAAAAAALGFVIFTAWCTQTASAEPAADAGARIGYVDLMRIRKDSKAGKDATANIEKLIKDKQAQVEQRKGELMKLKQEVERQEAVLSKDVIEQKKEKLQKEAKDLQRFMSDSEEEINKKEAEITNQMIGDVSSVINKFGKEEGYTLILERSVVLYAPDAVDVTDKVIKAYDDTKK